MVEADSFWLPETAEVLVAKMQEGFDAVCTDLRSISDCGRVILTNKIQATMGYRGYWSACHLIRRDVFREFGGYNTKWLCAEQE